MTNSIFAIECNDEVMKSIEEHCFSETSIEVGGFLIGKIDENKAIAEKYVK